jgi:hypothetical protein
MLVGAMRFELSGTEAHTIECEGVLARDAARTLVPGELELATREDGVGVGLLCFAMHGLGAAQPVRVGPRFDYGEALWRVGVMWQGAPAWFAVVCDLDRPIVRGLGAWLVRYPVRTATIVVDAARAVVAAERRALEVLAEPTEHRPEAVPPRPLLVAHRDALLRIPWREDPAPHRRRATIRIEDDGLARKTMGARVRWDPHGLVHRGRIHHCGIARVASVLRA